MSHATRPPEGIDRRALVELLQIDEGFVSALEAEEIVITSEGALSETVIERVRVSWSLHRELGVNLAGVEVILNLLDRITEERRAHAETLRLLLRERSP